jgi:hypothetical protein
MAESIDRNARCKIEIPVARGRIEPNALAPLKSEVDTRIRRQQMRGHGGYLSSYGRKEMCRLSGRHEFHLIGGLWPVNNRTAAGAADSISTQSAILRENRWNM